MLLRILIPLLLLLRFPAAPAERDALAISAGIAARHLPHGTVLDPLFAGPASNRITGYTRAGDSATWTGHYLAAEAFRYRATRDPKALEQVKRALAGIRLLVDVTGTGLLARCALPRNSPYGPASIAKRRITAFIAHASEPRSTRGSAIHLEISTPESSSALAWHSIWWTIVRCERRQATWCRACSISC